MNTDGHRSEFSPPVSQAGSWFAVQPGGLADISRGLRSAERDDTPGRTVNPTRPWRGRSVSIKKAIAGIPPGCIPLLRRVRGYRSARPPANGCQPFRLKTRRTRSAERHSAVSPTRSRLGAAIHVPVEISNHAFASTPCGLPIRETADCQSALPTSLSV